ncbi:MAG: DUF5677 domain-containing protein [Clostridiales bacterium]|nr:DUF5677 domain-containing protein [Clostridiales bacterium]
MTPLNSLDQPLDEISWFHDRLPEYVWIGLIIKKFGRTLGLNYCGRISNLLKTINTDMNAIRFSNILALDAEKQKHFWHEVVALIGTEVIAPLTAIFTHSEHPVFAEIFCSKLDDYDQRAEKIRLVLHDASDHQTYFATDIRFVVLYSALLSGKLFVEQEMGELILKYPLLSHKNEEMRLTRPTVRSMEATANKTNNEEYLNCFWEAISKMTDCNLFCLPFEKCSDDSDIYMNHVRRIMDYYAELFASTSPLDKKMLVLLGMTTYSYKCLLELVNHDLYNAILGRIVIRILIEGYIMMKHLLKNESSHTDIWSDYQCYGIGQYKLIAKRGEETERKDALSHVLYEYLGFLVNETKDEELINMDTKYFDNQGIREKAIAVGEKELFGLYYDYDSAFAHGLWGAIRESALLKCDEASHHYHCVPDIEDKQKLASVWHDCKMVMDKTLGVLYDVYGLPQQYTTGVSDG